MKLPSREDDFEDRWILLEILDTTQLSPRELQVVGFALDGLTDQQIANELQISVSTVSSYWVRIRGKVGHLSRTELVGRLLKQKSLIETKRLKDLIVDLEKKISSIEGKSLPAQPDSLLFSVLGAMPYPMMALSAEGVILYANERVATILGVTPDILVGTPFDAHVQILEIPEIKPWLEKLEKVVGGGVVRTYLGILRSSGRISIRMSVTTGTVAIEGGCLFTCVLRPLSDELTNFRDAANEMLSRME